MHIPFVYVNCGIAQNLSFSKDSNTSNGDMKKYGNIYTSI